MNSEYSEAISETLEVLKYMEVDLLNKIPLEVIKKLKEQTSKSYTNKFDENLEVDPTKLSDKAKDILAVIYRDYIASEEEKIEFDKMLYENEIKANKQDYSIKKFEKQEPIKQEQLPVVNKKSFLQKILDKLFRKNTYD